MEKLTKRQKEKMETLKFQGNTFSRHKVSDPLRQIEIEIGDKKQADFYPQVKTKHWGNECNLSVRLKEDAYEGELQRVGQKVEWKRGNRTARLYELDGFEDGGFEFEVELAEKPDTNVVEFTIQHKGFQFLFQGELTKEEKSQGYERPENVIGSYAVYHKTAKNNWKNRHYRTGKAFHIYRPFAQDAEGKRVWCDLHIDEESGLMTITVPQKFLDEAIYPVIVDPTFGYTSIGATSSATSASTIAGTLATLSEPALVSKLTAHLVVTGDTWGAGENARGGIFDAAGNYLSYETNEVAGAQAPNAWYDFTFASPPTLAADDYLLCMWSSASITWAADSGFPGNNVSDNAGQTYPTWPASVTPSSTFAKSFYATYTLPYALPQVSTQAVDHITATTARGRGTLIEEGGIGVDERGFVWGAASEGNPGNVAPSTVYDDYVLEGGSFDVGAFTGVIDGLTEGVTYYVRAFAHNAGGYRYGDQVSFVAATPEPVKIVIDGTDRSVNVDPDTFNLTRALTSQVDTASFRITREGGQAGGGYKPSLMEEVYIWENERVIFGGVITDINERLLGGEVEAFDVQCKDFTHDMDRFLVVRAYEGETIGDIIADIVANVLPDGYTTTHVDCDIVVASVAFNYELPSRCFQQLAELVNYDWYVDYEKGVHFFEKSATPAPFDLTDDNGKYYVDSLLLRSNLTNIRNVITVRGGEYLGEEFSESFIADGEANLYPVGYRYDSIVVTVNATPITVGIDNLNDPNLYDALYNFQEKFIRWRQATKPALDDVVQVTGLPYLPILVRVQDNASVAEYGAFEYKIVDKAISSKQEARDRAEAELTAWAASTKEGGFDTVEPLLDVGQQINISSTLRGLDQDYIISRIVSTLRPNGRQYLHTVTLVTTKTYGMVEFLIALLRQRDKDIVINQNEVFGTIRTMSDEVEMADTLGTPVETSPPYLYGTTAICGFSTCSA